jgi:hypothetical protein
MERPVNVGSGETLTASPVRNGGGFSAMISTAERAVRTRPIAETGGREMTREEAYASCPDDSYVEQYGHQWLIVPFAPIEQPRFFVCTP